MKYCWPTICSPANTSHRRNSALEPPAVARDWPVTRPCALITRQSGKRGRASMFWIFSMNAFGIDRLKQARAPKIVGDDAGEIARELRVAAGDPSGIRDRDRKRLNRSLRDVELQHRLRFASAKRRSGSRGAGRQQQTAAGNRAARRQASNWLSQSSWSREWISRRTCRADRTSSLRRARFRTLPAAAMCRADNGCTARIAPSAATRKRGSEPLLRIETGSADSVPSVLK